MQDWLRAHPDYRAADDRVNELQRARERLQADLRDVRQRLRSAGAREEIEPDVERLQHQLERADAYHDKNRDQQIQHNTQRRQRAAAKTPLLLEQSGNTITHAPLVALPDDEETHFELNAREWSMRREYLRQQIEQLRQQIADEPPQGLPAQIAERLGIQQQMTKLDELRAERQQIESDLAELQPLLDAAEQIRQELLPAAKRAALPDAQRQLTEITAQRDAARDKLAAAEQAAESKLLPLRQQLIAVQEEKLAMDRLLSALTEQT